MSINPKSICLASLRQRVLSMEMAPGQLLDEVALSEEFGISRTPLREVIQRLCGEGVLVAQENRGARVAPMDFATMRHFFQAAPMIYASVARLAAQRGDKSGIDELRSVQQNYRRSIASGDVCQTAMHNHRFHQLIGEMAGSVYLMPSLNRLLIDHTRISQQFYQSRNEDDRRRIEQAADQHDAMIEAFASASPADAVQLTLDHWDLSRHQMEQFVTPDPLPFDLPREKQENNHAV